MEKPELIYVRCAVSCVNSNGEVDFYFCKVVCTQDEYDNGAHYYYAKEAAENEGYETHLAYDEVECPALMSLFAWVSADYIGPIGKPVTDRPTARPKGAPDITIDEMEEQNNWGEHPDHLRTTWQHEAGEGYTQLGYWDWVRHRVEETK